MQVSKLGIIVSPLVGGLLNSVLGDDVGGADCATVNPDGNRKYKVSCWYEYKDDNNQPKRYTATAHIENWLDASVNAQNATDTDYGCNMFPEEYTSYWSKIPSDKKFFYHQLTATKFSPDNPDDHPMTGNVWLTKDGPDNTEAIRFCNYWPSWNTGLNWVCACSN